MKKPLPRTAFFRRWGVIIVSLLSFSGAAFENAFVPNLGQWKGVFQFKADLPNHTAFFFEKGLRIVTYDVSNPHPGLPDRPPRVHAFDVHFVRGATKIGWTPQDKAPYYHNYYLGQDARRWRSHVPVYHKLLAPEVWPGIDVEAVMHHQQLKFLFHIREGAHYEDIALRFEGMDEISLVDGRLLIRTRAGTMIDLPPVAFSGAHPDEKIAVSFVVEGNVVRFKAAKVPEGAWTIDPIYVFSTYSGSSADNWGFTATPDTLGNAYAGGTVYNIGFPVTTGAFDTTYNGGNQPPGGGIVGDLPRDVAIWKVNATGTQLLYATYLGGSANEQPHSMVVNSDNRLVVMGTTTSSDFPVTANVVQMLHAGDNDIFISVFSEDGSQLVASTYIGGSGTDGLNGAYFVSQGHIKNSYPTGYNYGDLYRGEIIETANGDLLVVSSTRSANFPTTPLTFDNTYNGGQDAVCFKINAALSTLVWSTYLGGTAADAAYGVREASDGSVLVVGGTESVNFINAGGGYWPSHQGNVDGFVVKLSADGKQRQAATYIGTPSYDQVYLIDLGVGDNVYIVGQTTMDSFPVFNAPAAVPRSRHFIMKLTPTLTTALFSGTFGVPGKLRPDLSPAAFMVDKCGRIFFSGWSDAISRNSNITGYPTTSNAYQTTTDGRDFYLAVWASDMDSLLYASFYGGPYAEEHVDGGTSRFSKDGVIYQSVCAGCRGYDDFPTYPTNTVSHTNNSTNCNNAIFKIDFDLPVVQAYFESDTLHCWERTFRFYNRSSNADSIWWDLGDGTLSTDPNPTHTYAGPGSYVVTLYAYRGGICNALDSFSRTVHLYDTAIAAIGVDSGACPNEWILRNRSPRYDSVAWYSPLIPSGYLSSGDSVVVLVNDTLPHTYYLVADPATACADVDSVILRAPSIPTAAFTMRILDSCLGTVAFHNHSTASRQWVWDFGDGHTDTGQWDPVHAYDSPATYTVRLIIEPGKACADTAEKTFALGRIYADLFIHADSCTLTSLQFNTSRNYDTVYWMMDSIPYPAGDSFSYTWPRRGWHTVTLIARRDSSCHDTARRKVWVNTYVAPRYRWAIDTCDLTVLALADSPSEVSFGWVWNRATVVPGRYRQPFTGDPGPHRLGMITQPESMCADSAFAQIRLPAPDANLFIPNVFTPNGDGYNDVFRITGIRQCEFYNLYIYNRWGQIMFFSGEQRPRFAPSFLDGSTEAWDGTFDGRPAREGVFYYILQTPHYQKKGSVTLIR